MSIINITEPLFVSRAQSEIANTPLQDAAAAGATTLDSQQETVVLGEPVPIVFCRRVSSIGGALVSPKATEASYSNNIITNELSVNLELVLSEGQLPLVQIRDVFQRACRVGTWAQAYDARAGTWNPGNTVIPVAGKTFWNCPYYCGTSGSYDNMTTLSYSNLHADGDDTWDKQVHVFVRQGMQVTRIIDNTYGPSNNFVDLVLYLIAQTARVPSTLIDSAAMLTAAQFTNTNGFFFNGIVQESTNLEEWLYNTGAGFLLRFCDRAGKKILKPRLPINNDYTIKTTAITAEYKFTENDLLPNGFEIDYVPLEQRLPACIVVLWRQQPDDDIGIIRTTEVRFDGEAPNGPYEQYDLSEYCASENHAVKIGAYYAARRKYITHSLRIQVRPGSFNSTLELGDIVRVQLARETDVTDYALHDYYYEVDRISKATSGVVTLDLTHFPIDDQNRSLVALTVSAAVGAGYVMPTGRTDFSCDVAGRRTDTSTIPNTPDPDPPVVPDPANFEYDIPERTVVTPDREVTFGPDGAVIPGGLNRIISQSGGSSPSGTTSNPADPIAGAPPAITGSTGDFGRPVDGDTLLTSPTCPDGKVSWYKRPKNGGERQLLKEETISGSGDSDLSITTDEIDYYIEADTRCPDPSSPDGYGSAATEVIGPVEANYNFYNYVRWVGTLTRPPFAPTQVTSPWIAITGNDAATIGPLFGCSLIGTGTPQQFNNQTTCPAIGPIDWRAQSISRNKIASPSGSYALGGLTVYDKFAANNTNACTDFYAVTFVGTVPGRVYSVVGKWEFSVDGSAVAAEWEGRNEESEGN